MKLYHGDSYPFEIEIENYRALVKEQDDGRWEVDKSTATGPELPKKYQGAESNQNSNERGGEEDNSKPVIHSIRLSFDDARAMLREMERQVNGFFYANYAKADQEANNLEARRRKEASENFGQAPVQAAPAKVTSVPQKPAAQERQENTRSQNYNSNASRPAYQGQAQDTALKFTTPQSAPAPVQEQPAPQDYDYFFMPPEEEDYIAM